MAIRSDCSFCFSPSAVSLTPNPSNRVRFRAVATSSCSREAAFKRLTNVLSSRSSMIFCRSSRTFWNSASRSVCSCTASSTFSSAGFSGCFFFSGGGPPCRTVEGRPNLPLPAFDSSFFSESASAGFCLLNPDSVSVNFGTAGCSGPGFLGSPGSPVCDPLLFPA